jgi:hypothetical protein
MLAEFVRVLHQHSECKRFAKPLADAELQRLRLAHPSHRRGYSIVDHMSRPSRQRRGAGGLTPTSPRGSLPRQLTSAAASCRDRRTTTATPASSKD